MIKYKGFDAYKKWDFYENDSDEEQKEPILPKNDPNFIALEKDLNESMKQRELSYKKANKLREEANESMKQQKYKKAIRLYTEALEESKSILSLYTNRALAYLRINDYSNCIKDCDKLVEYLDVFDDKMEENKDLYSKALTRKAMALAKLKNFPEAVSNLQQALNAYPQEEIQKCLDSIQKEYEVHRKAIDVINKQKSPQQLLNFQYLPYY
jgi:tetratricopeptide (TPR) repeat protein